jgi:hypothetical protein
MKGGKARLDLLERRRRVDVAVETTEQATQRPQDGRLVVDAQDPEASGFGWGGRRPSGEVQ